MIYVLFCIVMSKNTISVGTTQTIVQLCANLSVFDVLRLADDPEWNRGRKTFSLLVPPSATEQGCHAQELPREGNDERKVCEMGEIVIFHLAVGRLHSLFLGDAQPSSSGSHRYRGQGCRDIPH